MISFKPFVIVAAAAFALTACQQPATNVAVNSANTANTGNANANAAKTTAATPTKDVLMAIEKQGWEAWKNHTPATFESILSSKYVGFGPKGRMDKAAAVKSFADAKCDIKSYSFSDDQMDMVGSDVAVLTFKAAQDGTCDGKKVPAAVWASSIYLREGDQWKNVLYVENPVTDPNAPAAKPVAAAPATAKSPEEAAKSDSLTTDLMAIETSAWDAWKARDVKAVEAVMASKFMYLSGSGRKDRPAAVKAWTEPKCEGLAYSFSDPMAVTLSKDAAMVTYKADVKGTCDGKPVDPSLWVASFDVKEGDAWKNAFYTDLKR